MTKTKAQKLRAVKGRKARKGPSKPRGFSRVSNAPVAMNRSMTTGKPRVVNTPTGMNITHRELIGLIGFNGGDQFNVKGYPIQPGDPLTFPWLSAIANRFETYSFNRLAFEFTPMVATTTAGCVGLTVDYDPLDEYPGSLPRFASYVGAKFSSVWSPSSMSCSREGLTKRKRYYVRTSALIPGSDLKTYDVGNFFLGGAGTPIDGTILGQVWVSYAISLQTPQLNANFANDSGTVNVDNPTVNALANGFAHFRTDNWGDPTMQNLPVINNSVNGQLLFDRSWNGIMQVEAAGTSLETMNITTAGDITAHSLDFILDAASGSATKASSTWSIDAAAGSIVQPWMFSSAGTPVLTSSSTFIRFAKGLAASFI